MVQISASTVSAQPLDTLLAAYAGGQLSVPLHVLIASHLEFNPVARPFVSAMEEACGNHLVEISPVKLNPSSRDIRLDSIINSMAPPAVPEILRSQSDVLPTALRGYIGKDFSDIRWRWKMPGLKEFHIESRDGYEASLLWIRAGRKMPSHTHDGSEVTLVLKGSFGDAGGHYVRGDVAIADADVDHSPRAGLEEDCICFAVTDAPLRLTGGLARLLHRFGLH